MTLSGCTIEDVLEIGSNNTNVVESTWFKNDALTNTIGAYSNADNAFTPTNLSSIPPASIYFNVSNGNCSYVVQNTIDYPEFSNITYDWEGRVSSDWNDPCNWDSWKVPNSNQKVNILDANYHPEISSTSTLEGLTVKSNGHLTIASGGELHLEDGSFSHMLIEEGGVVDNYGFLELVGGGSTGFGMSVQGTFNNYDSIAISQHLLGGLFIAGTMNMYSGHANVFFNDLHNVKVSEVGAIHVDPGATLANLHAGPADDVGLINSGTISNDGTFESFSFFGYPTESAVENDGEIINNGLFRAGGWGNNDTIVVNQGIITNTGSFIIESSVVESPFSLSNQGTITNALGGIFDIIGFEKTFCLPGSVLTNEGTFNLVEFE